MMIPHNWNQLIYYQVQITSYTNSISRKNFEMDIYTHGESKIPQLLGVQIVQFFQIGPIFELFL